MGKSDALQGFRTNKVHSGSSRCGFMTITNVSNWFANRRKREFHRSVPTPDAFSPGPPNYGSTPTGGGNGVRPLWSADLTIPSPHHPSHHHPHHHHNGGAMHPTTIKEEPLDFDTARSYDREVLPDSGMPWHSADLESAVAAHVAATPFEPVGVGPLGLGQEQRPPMHHAMDSNSPVTNLGPSEGSVMTPHQHQQAHQQAHQQVHPQQQQPPVLHQPVKQEGSDPWPLANGILAQAWR
ncbi:hypothetical protein HPB48_020665 [Haemaphysalis longicornis]|uniref:Homeobox domain-containing protein n=1 Tax=Haemaphysalis longicornis TaxID=44386 RepID=A0A9J6FLM1_HAELO|nr:hypothetical protein HPB48_020665 [Haemaphysalis longicornis]